jgi:molybdopterin synthase catalytic subunit
MGFVRIQEEPFLLDELVQGVSAQTGGVLLYVGTVRADDDGRHITHLDVEAYGTMAHRQLEALRAQTIERFGLVDATILHRTGRLEAGAAILVVALHGRHRKETFAAMDFFMNELKTRIPIWKRESGQSGPTWILGADRQRVAP